MNAFYLLSLLAESLRRSGLDAILIGNAAAALRGAPVTTDDFDFLVRLGTRTPSSIEAMAKSLGARIIPPTRRSTTIKLHNADLGLDVDLLAHMAGIRSFGELASHSTTTEDFGQPLRVASLADVIRSKTAAGRPKDLAVLPVLIRTLHEQEPQKSPTRSHRVRPRGRARRG